MKTDGTHYLEIVEETLRRVYKGEVEKAVDVLEEAYWDEGNVWIVGNGGSAATASHFANDLVKMTGTRAFAVADMTPTMLAYGNDEGWENMFSNVIARLLQDNDVLVAISCGGRSKNVIEAAKLFDENHLLVLTGNRKKSPLAKMPAAAQLFVDADDIRVQEDVHMVMCHCMVTLLAERLGSG